MQYPNKNILLINLLNLVNLPAGYLSFYVNLKGQCHEIVDPFLMFLTRLIYLFIYSIFCSIIDTDESSSAMLMTLRSQSIFFVLTSSNIERDIVS